MLFELMDRNVWSKASKDTTGLKAFYETKKNKYMWEPGFSGAVYTFKNEKAYKDAEKLLSKKGVTDEELMKKVNTTEEPDGVTVVHGRYEYAKYKDFTKEELVKGKPTKAKKNDNGSYTVTLVEEVYNNPTPKSLIEAKGYIVAEYQDYLEKKWHEELRAKYPMKVEETVFKSMVK
jgi:peptidyl-prolyl cis-trans isomerase SurA